MRQMEELFEENKRVWFYVAEEWGHLFFEELQRIDAKFMNGDDIKAEDIGMLMGVGRDKTVGYISYFIWYYSFNSKNAMYPKVDYGKYCRGESNYVIS